MIQVDTRDRWLAVTEGGLDVSGWSASGRGLYRCRQGRMWVVKVPFCQVSGWFERCGGLVVPLDRSHAFGGVGSSRGNTPTVSNGNLLATPPAT